MKNLKHHLLLQIKKKKQEGDYFENLLTYNLTLNKLDQNYQPSDGFKLGFEQILPIY